MASTDLAHDEAANGRVKERRQFKIELAIFLFVNALLVAAWAVITVAGAHVTGELWPWPVATAIWATVVAVHGLSAYRVGPRA